MPWYAVYPGHRPGIYTEWDGANGARVASSKYPGEHHPSFDSEERALNWYFGCIFGARHETLQPQWGKPAKTPDVRVSDTGSRGSGLGVRADGLDVGRWGEEFVFRAWCLRLLEQHAHEPHISGRLIDAVFAILKEGKPIAGVEWRNAHQESGSSPDLLVAEGIVEKSVEAKSTMDAHPRVTLTPDEYRLAKAQRGNFCLAIVSRAMTTKAIVTEYWDPVQVFSLSYQEGTLPESAKRPQPLRLPDTASADSNDRILIGERYGDMRLPSGRLGCRVLIREYSNGTGKILVCRISGGKYRFIVDQPKVKRLYESGLSMSGDGRSQTNEFVVYIWGGSLAQQLRAIKAATTKG